MQATARMAYVVSSTLPARRRLIRSVRRRQQRSIDFQMDTTNYQKGHNFETEVIDQLRHLETLGVLTIQGRNLRECDKDGIPREIDISIVLRGAFYSVDVFVECKNSASVGMDVIDKIRALRSTTRFNNYLIVTDRPVSGPAQAAAGADNIPIVLFADLVQLVEQMVKNYKPPNPAPQAKIPDHIHFMGDFSPGKVLPLLLADTVPIAWSTATPYWGYLLVSKSPFGHHLLTYLLQPANISLDVVKAKARQILPSLKDL